MAAIEIDITGYLKLLEYEKELKSQRKSLYHENKKKVKKKTWHLQNIR